MATSRHPRIGRPRRQDWRLPASLFEVPAGEVVVLCTSADGGGQRRGVLARVDDRWVHYADGRGEDRRVALSAVVRWRPADSLLPVGALVARVGVPEARWRGVVVDVLDDGVVEVETVHGRELVVEDELEDAERRLRRAPVSLPPGPPASDPAVEHAKRVARAS